MTPLGVTGHIIFFNYIFVFKIFIQKVELRGTMFFEVVLEGFLFFGFFCGGGFEAAVFYLATAMLCCAVPLKKFAESEEAQSYTQRRAS